MNVTTSATSATSQPALPVRYLRPGLITRRIVNPLVAACTRRGLSLQGSAVLEVVGRRSGETRATPVNPLGLHGSTYLVAPRGTTDWVRNVRAGGAAALVRRRRTSIELTEVADADKAPVIRAYLDAWAWEVGAFFPGLSKDSDDAAVAAVARDLPVFRIV